MTSFQTKRNPTHLLTTAVFLFLAMLSLDLAQDKNDNAWPEISPADLALKDNPAKPGSSAMILVKRENRDDTKQTWQIFYRIKVLTEQGREQADIEIPYIPSIFEVDQISARVVQSDGGAADFKGPIYQKVLAIRQKLRVMAKTFTLPDVKAGAIIDYRYVMKWKSSRPRSGPWVVQEKLFIRRAELQWRPNNDGVPWRVLPRVLPADSGTNLLFQGSTTLTDLPAYEEEVLMPPEETSKMRFLMYRDYASLPVVIDPRTTLQDYVNKFIGKPNAFAAAIKELTAQQDTPEEKVRKLYGAVQERIRNLSYEEEYTKQERKRENIKERNSAQDVWRLGYGSDDEIVFLFAALCRAAGLTADPLAVVQRDGQFYDSEIPITQQINGWLVAVQLPSGLKAFDPGVRFAPPGLISWPKQGVRGLRFGATATATVETPRGRADENQLQRKITIALRADGSADVQLVTTYSGEDAVDRRNDFFDVSKKEREELLRRELKSLLPSARIQTITWDGMDDAGTAATVSYHFELRDFGQVLGSRLILEPRLFQRASPFSNWNRTYPVYLRRSVDSFQEVRIIPPAGYQLEQTGPNKEHKLTLRNASPGVYVSSTSQDAGGAVVHVTRLTTDAAYIVPEEYVAVKQFYDNVANSERTYVVLHK